MKKTLLAVAIPAVLAAGNVNAFEAFSSDEGAVEVYGQLRTTLAKEPNKDLELKDGSSRAGINANYSIAEGVEALATLEYSISFDADALKNRLGYFGFTGDFGTVYLGKQYNTASDLWGPSEGYFFGGSAIPQGALSGGKHDSSIRYIYNADSFFVDVSYGLPEDDKNAEIVDVFGGFSVSGFDVTLGVAKEEHNAWGEGKLKVEDLFRTAWVYKSVGDFTFGAGYAASTTESKTGNREVERSGITTSVQYNVADHILVYGGAEFSEYEANFVPETIDQKGDATNFYLGGHYKFNQYFRVYSEVAFVDGTTLGFENKESDMKVKAGSSADSDVRYAIGARVYW